MFVARMYTVRHFVGVASTFVTGHTNEGPLSVVWNLDYSSCLPISLLF